MKNILKTLIFVFTLVGGTSAVAQISEGIITAKQTFNSDDAEIRSQLSMLGETSVKTYFKHGNMRVEMKSPIGTTTTISQAKSKEALVLINSPLLGQKYIKQTSGNVETDNGVDIEKTSETKTILGYKCIKYIISSEDTDMIFWVAPDLSSISAATKGQYSDKIVGLPLITEVEASQMGINFTIKLEVTEIKEMEVSDDKFQLTIPDGYEETTSDAIKSMGM